ncbi:hypothetical protein NM688_g8421 [Phlebia brevispora]|uniref:Uncharacterized protein n=1 Tax=Phlebia brevispora TaxID=194682 RepID=A0ACC1RTE5_9APHY|nr:hypothetical protein NM688_g8421 [Phlebia brevispora]
MSDNPKLDKRAKERHVLSESIDVYVWRPWLKLVVPVCETKGAFGYGSVLGGKTIWLCQRYFVPLKPAEPAVPWPLELPAP